MAESRADSLAAELKRLGIFDDYFAWRLQSRPTFAEALDWMDQHNCSTSAGALHRLHKSPEAGEWRNAEAARARQALDAVLPSDIDSLIRKSLLDQRFNATLGELTHKQLMDHVRVQQDEMLLSLKERQVAQKDEDLAQRDRRIRLLEENAQIAKDKLQVLTTKGGLSEETLKMIEEAARLL